MALTTVTCLVYGSLLLFGGVSPQDIYRYSRAGEDITLPCESLTPLSPTCSSVTWLHYKSPSSSSTYKVYNGRFLDRDSRLRLDSDCSLTVQNVSAQDSGSFACLPSRSSDSDTNVFLNVLTVSSPDTKQHGNITLRCTLWRYTILTCSEKSFLWLDQNKETLSGKTKNCVSDLTVELQSPHSGTFTCLYREKGKVLVSAEYSLIQPEKEKSLVERTTPAPRGNCDESQPEGWWWFLVLKTVGWTALMSTSVIVCICTRDKKRVKSNREYEMTPVLNPRNMVPEYENQQ